MDLAFNHARDHKMAFRFHTLIWGNQQPLWIADLPPAEQMEEIIEWYAAASARYPGTSWPAEVPFHIDVVNEPINDPPNHAGDGGNYVRALLGPTGSGYDWIVRAFELARQYFPTAKLFLNEYNILNNDNRTGEYIFIVNLLKSRNLIDGVGIQCHRFEIESTPVSQLRSNLNRIAATGVPIAITEFNLGNLGNNGTPDDQQQLELYQRIFPVLWDHPAVHGITLWGYVEGATWQSTAHLLRRDGSERPALTWLRNYVPTTGGGTFCITTGTIDELIHQTEQPIRVFPNPSADGRFVVETGQEQAGITVRDIFGRVLSRFQSRPDEPLEIFVSDRAGVYFIEITTGSRIELKKVLIR
jgi:endo-1,4-beta-xylanase